jgi:hypothetical protein
VVANQPVERPESMDYLINKINDLERRLNELTAQSKFPFSVAHGTTKDFTILPSSSGDGTADLWVGDGAGNPALRTRSVPNSGFKIVELFDAAGGLLYSTDSITGWGLGNPCFPFPLGGKEQITLAGATAAGSATEIGLGSNFVWNPALWLQPQIRLISPTAATVKLFATFTGPSVNYTTTERTVSVPAGNVASQAFYNFATYFDASDIRGIVGASIKAYVSAGTPGDVNVRLTPWRGTGVSRGYADQNLQAAL